MLKTCSLPVMCAPQTQIACTHHSCSSMACLHQIDIKRSTRAQPGTHIDATQCQVECCQMLLGRHKLASASQAWHDSPPQHSCKHVTVHSAADRTYLDPVRVEPVMSEDGFMPSRASSEGTVGTLSPEESCTCMMSRDLSLSKFGAARWLRFDWTACTTQRQQNGARHTGS